ncbi:hypothetical protein SLEP1_g53288 [Rubroshorea leprosula]|uniref:Uncharacterized protein n=1 Tax=Rubroshorea leprosula TaxID=152421 RepID=A0AAV5MCI5_9ROSI|nr:hypothetical protein SLEP1_g53288 [Rubroshorea leprosula]
MLALCTEHFFFSSHKEISFQPLSCSAMNPWPDLCKEVYQLSRDEGNTG